MVCRAVGVAGVGRGGRQAVSDRFANRLLRRDGGLPGSRSSPRHGDLPSLAAAIHAGAARRRATRLDVLQRLSDDRVPDRAALRLPGSEGRRRHHRGHGGSAGTGRAHRGGGHAGAVSKHA